MSRGIAFNSPQASVTTTWSPTDKSSLILLSGGNLIASRATGTVSGATVRATVGKASTSNGYFEVAVTTSNVAANFMTVGLATASAALGNFLGNDAFGWAYYEQTGETNTNAVRTAYGTSYAQGDVIGVAFKNGSVWFAKNNTWQNGGNPSGNTGAAFTGLAGTLFPAVALYNGTYAPTDVVTGKFAAGSLTYSPPSGFAAWG